MHRDGRRGGWGPNEKASWRGPKETSPPPPACSSVSLGLCSMESSVWNEKPDSKRDPDAAAVGLGCIIRTPPPDWPDWSALQPKLTATNMGGSCSEWTLTAHLWRQVPEVKRWVKLLCKSLSLLRERLRWKMQAETNRPGIKVLRCHLNHS